MIKTILSNTDLPIKKRLKNLLFYYSRKRGAEKSWSQRHERVFSANETYRTACDEQVEAEHKNRWAVFRKNVDLDTLRICANMSGKSDARMVPEDIFVSDIEPTLMDNESAHFFSHKSFYNRWFPDGTFPESFLHGIEGRYLDSDLKEIHFDELSQKAGTLSFPVVMKPNVDSFGGQDVFIVKSAEELIHRCRESQDFVVQERVLQHHFFEKFNPVGLNTIRVYIYKSVKDNTPHVLSMALRMGKGGSLDNETSGGIHTRIRENGFLNRYAVDKYGTKYTEHPDTGYTFDIQVPAHEELKQFCLDVAGDVFFARIIGLDVTRDREGNWKVIEINTQGHTIRFSQYGGKPFFGEFTDEVIEYCKTNHWALQ
ncbi:sugar-transfer associated ATP-grasp domain-containing protein [Halalkalibaculum sp. DA3122]|uniref:sugar-transfer associated ATP-grasp domain-containing protein n=1 Tax=Halalkalibaculum sp. DA3122 TaxID=3373607 RepID=UPI003754FE44